MFFQIGNCSLKTRLLFGTLYLYAIYCSLCEAQCPPECMCNWKGRVNCETAGLHEIPSDLPAKANILILSYNFIDVINEEFLQNMQDILDMQLAGNTIQRIPPNTFSPCSNLVVLNLRGNRIATLPKEVFAGLNRLKVLDLSGNNINEIHPQAFRPLDILQELNLYDNSLRQLTDGIFRNLRYLRQLNLGKSKFISITSSKVFRGLGNLTRLNLGENAKLNSLPKGMFFELPDLKSLDLQGCELQTLTPDIFDGVTVLEELKLHNNELRNTLPLQVFDKIPNLVSLRIDNNHLMSLHESVLSSIKRLDKVYLQNNNWQCSCGLLNVRARWPSGKPKFLQEGLTCEGPITLKPPRDLWNISLKDLQDQCVAEMGDAEVLHLPNNFSDELFLECPISQTVLSVLDWITADGHYVTKTSINYRYRVFDNGTLYVSKAQSGTYICSVTVPSGESSRAVYRVTFSDALFGSPVSPEDPEDSPSHHSNANAFLVPSIIIALILVIAVIVVLWRCRRSKGAIDKQYNSPFQHSVPVKNMDHTYAYAYVSAHEGKTTKKKRDISAYAINALFEFKLPECPEFEKNHGYDHIKGQRPKSHSCRERKSKDNGPDPVPRPSNTLDSRGTSRAESCIYVTPTNDGGMGMFFSTSTNDGLSLSDPDMEIPIYGATRMNDDGIQDKGLKRLRELQSKTLNGSMRPKSNPYIELIV